MGAVIELRPAAAASASELQRLGLDVHLAWNALQLSYRTMCAADNPISRALHIAAAERHERCFNAWLQAGGTPPEGAA